MLEQVQTNADPTAKTCQNSLYSVTQVNIFLALVLKYQDWQLQ